MTDHEQSRPHLTETADAAPTVAAYSRSARDDGSAQQRARDLAFEARQNGSLVDAVFAESRSWGIRDQMLATLAAYDVVLVSDFSRLTRRASCVREILQRFRDADVRLIVGGEAIRRPRAALPDDVLRHLRLDARQTPSRRVKAEVTAARARREEQR